MDQTPYNPLDKKNLAVSVTDALLGQSVVSLPPEEFNGAGIYAIYYTGDFGAYRFISERNKENRYELPIYVGKAVPAGARKGGFSMDASTGKALCKRLAEHAASIVQATNLNLEDFSCRYLVVDDIWIPLAESLLIEKFSPVWNTLIDGFGNHDPGSGRNNQQRSRWDVLHPGRAWAQKLQDNKSSEYAILEMISKRFDK